MDGLTSLARFLQLNDEPALGATGDCESQSLAILSHSMDDPKQEFAQNVSEIERLSSLCARELALAESRCSSDVADKVSDKAQTATANEPSAHSIRAGVSRSLSKDPLHATLLQVMEERDKLHCRIVAEQVLHASEIEQYKEEIAHLRSQLQDAKRESATKNSPKSLVERKTLNAPPQKSSSSSLQQDSDAELLSLCQQLAGEISARTATELQVLRLEQARAAERQSDAAERERLHGTVADLQKQVEQERSEAQRAQQECAQWKQAYEAATKHSATAPSTTTTDKHFLLDRT
jgi:DNA repair exonuclease SbcCD ATPase subunit